MHELSLSEAIVATALRHAEGRRVTLVGMRVGHLRQVVPDSLAFYFEIVARGTACEGARLALESVPATLRCGGCGHAFSPDVPAFRCPLCAAGDVTVEHGDEFQIDYIEVEEVDACTRST
jgi:hydrogenase nickel incorporation protein HypA/HybF